MRYCSNILLLLFILIHFHIEAQPIGWTEKVPFTVTENKGTLLLNYQVNLVVNTQALVSAGKMKIDGQDIRFAKDCAGNLPLSYWIDMPTMNTATTNIWVKIDSLPADSTRTFYLFHGNASATGLSNLNTFQGPFSSTNGLTGGSINSSANSQRGFRFFPKEDLLVKSLGKIEPTGTPRYITLFDFTSQVLMKQLQVSGAASTYSYADLSAPIWLTANTHYVLTQFQATGDSYYFTDAQTNSHLNFVEMRFKNTATQNTFPTSSLANKMYGYPDMLYYIKKSVTPAPTIVLNASNADVIANPLADAYKCNNMSATHIGNPTFLSGKAPFSYSWTPSSTLDNPLLSSPLSSATTATSFTAYITDAYGCQGSITQNLKISASPTSVYSNANGSCTNTRIHSCEDVSGNSWIHFSDDVGQIIASIQPNNNILGKVAITLYDNSLAAGDMALNNNQSGILWNYGNKTWIITADSTPSAPVGIRFYYTPMEFSALVAASACSNCAEEDLILTRASFATSGMEDCDASNNATASYSIYWNKSTMSPSNIQPLLQNDITGVSVAGYYGNISTAGNNGYTQSNQSAYAGKYFEAWTDGFSEFRMNMRSAGIFPVQLASFKGWNQENVNTLIWMSNQEINSAMYVIERSENAKDYMRIGQVAAAGTSYLPRNYAFSDNHAPLGKAYYRLKMVDIDGTFQYSDVIELYQSLGEKAYVSLAPNPTKDKVHIQLYVAQASEIVYTITDINGRELKHEKRFIRQGSNDFEVSLEGLSLGIYSFHFQLPNGSMLHQRVVLTQ